MKLSTRACRLLLIGLTSLSLTACATRSVPVQVPVPILPPDSLLQDCPEPKPGDLLTNADIVRYVNRLKDALGLCNVDKQALRAWRDGVQE